jgi:septum formation protein
MFGFVYLASASPRRRELLAQLGVDCRVVPAAVDESRQPGESAARYVKRLAREKAAAARRALGGVDELVIGADTAVVVDDRILGKPRDGDDAQAMLMALSGRCHEVVTGVAVLGPERGEDAISRSRVCFRVLEPAEARAYWDTGEPVDKAGGYAIQGRAAMFVESLQGSYSGVVGLPLFETARLLAAFDYGLLMPGQDATHG